MNYFVDDLINSIKLRSMAPISQKTFDDDKILSISNEELQTKLVSDLITIRENYFASLQDVSIESGVERYSIPKRAIGGTLKDIFFIDSAGNLSELEYVDYSRILDYQTSGNVPQKYSIMGDEIIVMPTPNVSVGKLRFNFAKMPNAMTFKNQCAKINSIIIAGPTISFLVDTDLTSLMSVGTKIDFISSSPPFKTWFEDCSITQITSTQIDVNLSSVADISGVQTNIEIGDYICLSGDSCYPQIPVSFHHILAQMVVVRIFESLGDLNKLNNAKATLDQMRKEATALIKNRVENSPIRYVIKNSLMRYVR